MIARVLFSMALALLTLSPASARSRTAIGEIARQFDRHPLIMIGELHRGFETHAFLQQLLRAPVFICKADDVVVEFGNSRLQALADDYVSGGEVSEAQLQSLWRETAVPLTWNSPVYRQIYETVRDINRTHLCPHPIRILLGDPPLDWTKVQTAKDLEPFSDRDGSYAEVVEREVLAKHHHALLIAGKLHALKLLPQDMQSEYPDPTVAQLIEREHPGALFAIVTVPQAAAARALNMAEAPSFRPVRGTTLARADFQLTDYNGTVALGSVNGRASAEMLPDRHWPRMAEVVDGLLYLGGNHSVYPAPTIYLDPAYQQELRRRAAIIKDYSGQDFLTVIDDLVKQAGQGKSDK